MGGGGGGGGGGGMCRRALIHNMDWAACLGSSQPPASYIHEVLMAWCAEKADSVTAGLFCDFEADINIALSWQQGAGYADGQQIKRCCAVQHLHHKEF